VKRKLDHFPITFAAQAQIGNWITFQSLLLFQSLSMIRTTVRIMDALAKEFDSDVHNWKKLLERKLDQVRFT